MAVAFSGGVDSAVVAKAATIALGENAVAVTAVSPSLAFVELQDARNTARQIGIRHVEISTTEFRKTEYRVNRGDRCFHCKDTLYTATAEILDHCHVAAIVNGSNVDDMGDYRPGMRAATNHSVISPLIEEEIDKATVRELAEFWKLDVADKPASPCLSSRIAYGVEVTEERVSMVEKAEAAVRETVPDGDLRVRLESNDIARIEVPVDQLSRLVDSVVRVQLVDRLRLLGFSRVTLDLQGFQSGSFNERLTDGNRQFVPLGGAKPQS